jgi:hypothetical protein
MKLTSAADAEKPIPQANIEKPFLWKLRNPLNENISVPSNDGKESRRK